MKWLTPRGRPVVPEAAWQAAPPPARYRKETGGAPGLPFRIGQSVVHAKFGQGVIVNAEGSGTDARVQINFGPQGMKWLQLEYAKLQAA
jgi:DNA helicase-2/ATP-dependent DNA helicase PcrA